MADTATLAAHQSIAAFAGETVAKAVTTLARGQTLAPFGAARAESGSRLKPFAVERGGKLDLAESSEQALQWLEEEATRADICMIVVDGYINDEDSARSNAVVGRVLSLKQQLLVDVALPYEPNDDDEGFSFSEPVYRFSGVAAEDEEIEPVTVDADAFDAAFRSAFMQHAPAM
jgi:hypothetical protein